VMCS